MPFDNPTPERPAHSDEALKILRDGWALIDSPFKWTQGTDKREGPRGTQYCSRGALYTAAFGCLMRNGSIPGLALATRALVAGAGLEPRNESYDISNVMAVNDGGDMSMFGNVPTPYARVTAMWKRAIELVERGEVPAVPPPAMPTAQEQTYTASYSNLYVVGGGMSFLQAFGGTPAGFAKAAKLTEFVT